MVTVEQGTHRSPPPPSPARSSTGPSSTTGGRRQTRSLYLPRLRRYQEPTVTSRKEVEVVLSAPQLGKTTAGGSWLLKEAWERPGILCWWAAPTYEQCLAGLVQVKQIAGSSGILAGVRETKGNLVARLVNGSWIAFKSWKKPEQLSGPTVHAMVVDEAHLLSLAAWQALKNRLGSTMGPRRIFGNAGSVEGQFKAICDEAADPENRERQGFTKWTWQDKYEALGGEATSGGARYRRWIDAERLASPEWLFAEVWEAEWSQNLAAVFFGVDAAVQLPGKLGPEKGKRYVIGWDIAESVDYTVGAVVQLGEPRRCVAMLRYRRIDYVQNANRIDEFSRLWNEATNVIEVNGPGKPVYDELRRRPKKNVRAWTTTGDTKHAAVIRTSADIERTPQRLVLARGMDPMPNELKAFKRRRTPNHNYVYSAPEGGHDDCVMALCIANKTAYSMAIPAAA